MERNPQSNTGTGTAPTPVPNAHTQWIRGLVQSAQPNVPQGQVQPNNNGPLPVTTRQAPQFAQRLKLLETDLRTAAHVPSAYQEEILKLYRTVYSKNLKVSEEQKLAALLRLETLVPLALQVRDTIAANKQASAQGQKVVQQARYQALAQRTEALNAAKQRYFPPGAAADLLSEGEGRQVRELLEKGMDPEKVAATLLENTKQRRKELSEEGLSPEEIKTRLATEALGASQEYLDYLNALKLFEQNRPDPNARAALEKAATACLARYGKLPRNDQERKGNLREKQVCEAALKMIGHLKLAAELEALPRPTDNAPWDAATEDRAASLYAKLLFEEGDSPARPNATSGVSGSWWVDQVDFTFDFDKEEDSVRKQLEALNPMALKAETHPELGLKVKSLRQSLGDKRDNGQWSQLKERLPAYRAAIDLALKALDLPPLEPYREQRSLGKKRQKTFIFKPTDTEAEIPGFPKGGSACREVLGKAISTTLEASTGLQFGVPDTRLVAIDNAKLGDADGLPADPSRAGQQRVGSMQSFAKARGELQQIKDQDPSFLKTIPVAECHKMAILDLVTLNLDRHSGNFMIGGDEGGPPRLVPIDHGLVLPSREGLAMRRSKLGFPHSALTKMPGSDQPFSREMLGQLAMIDPDEVARGMQEAVSNMKTQHPEAAQLSEITEENTELVKRSVQFLKKAAAAGLTLNEIYDAYVEDMEKIFDSSADTREQEFDQAIQAAQARSATRKKFEALCEGPSLRPEVLKTLKQLGWGFHNDIAGTALMSFCVRNQELAVRIYEDKIENPALRLEMDKMLHDLRTDLKKLKAESHSLADAWLTVKEEHDKWAHTQLEKVGKAAGVTRPNGDDPQALEEYERDLQLAKDYEAFGGDKKLKELGYPKPDKMTFAEKATVMRQAHLRQASEDGSLARLRTAFPREKTDTPEAQFEALKKWREYEALGGDKDYYRLGGNAELARLDLRLVDFRRIKSHVDALPKTAKASAPTQTQPARSPEKSAALQRLVKALRERAAADFQKELTKLLPEKASDCVRIAELWKSQQKRETTDPKILDELESLIIGLGDHDVVPLLNLGIVVQLRNKT